MVKQRYSTSLYLSSNVHFDRIYVWRMLILIFFFLGYYREKRLEVFHILRNQQFSKKWWVPLHVQFKQIRNHFENFERWCT